MEASHRAKSRLHVVSCLVAIVASACGGNDEAQPLLGAIAGNAGHDDGASTVRGGTTVGPSGGVANSKGGGASDAGAPTFGGTNAGGTRATGSAGSYSNGGATSTTTKGGATSGGATSGGATSGGTTSGGAARGGAASGGVTSASGGTGGVSTSKAGAGMGFGGAASGGARTGGAPSVGGATLAGAAGASTTSCPNVGHVTYTLAKAASPTTDQQTAYARITQAMDEAVRYYNCYTDITKTLNVSYVPSVATADGNINGSIRFGSTASMNRVTAMHEIAHTVGVGTAARWASLVVGGKFTGSSALAQLLALPNRLADSIGADSQHFWPYGLNYESEGKNESDLVGHCLMVVAIRKDLGL